MIPLHPEKAATGIRLVIFDFDGITTIVFIGNTNSCSGSLIRIDNINRIGSSFSFISNNDIIVLMNFIHVWNIANHR